MKFLPYVHLIIFYIRLIALRPHNKMGWPNANIRISKMWLKPR